MEEIEFEQESGELLSILADIVAGKDIKRIKILIDLRIEKWNLRIDNLTDANHGKRVLYVELCFQYYRLKDSYYTALE